jgi:serine-type D-Ala-D-Ala carboxypeptidase/endopeptidase (penicillin-binding protein 4)
MLLAVAVLLTGCSSSSGSGSARGSSTAVASTATPSASAPQTVLPGLATAAVPPVPAKVGAVIAPLLKAKGLGSSVGAQVVDVASGTTLYSLNAGQAVPPASTAKLFTAAAALSVLGPRAQLSTTVVTGATTDEIVLVGGGDVLLNSGAGDPDEVDGRAGLVDLARSTADSLKLRGRTTVALRLDDSLFTGSAVNSSWDSDDVSDGYVAPVMALEVDEGRTGKGDNRQTDPALSAAQTFATLLKKSGITVAGKVVRGQAPEGSEQLGTVRSAPVSELVEHTLTVSDNTVAEALARLVATRSGRPTTFSDAGLAVVDKVSLLGVPTQGVQLGSGSGLGDTNKITPRALSAVLTLAASEEHPELRAILTGLPVAGGSGTLETRFDTAAQKKVRGLVRAKTGTLTGVSSLAGIVVDARGRLLAFAIMASRTASTMAARSALDSVATALAGCGCR